ncbi:MAG TPA: ATPase [Candidatus Altiarchaeales archaeon]|nr:ATPase [Candidatus Altiarchaeales archaeon]
MNVIEVERCKTGIEGLDEILNGGIPRGRVIMLVGGCGTGKTIFGSQFLYRGATEYDEPGIFVNLEEHPEKLKQDMLSIGIDLGKLEKEKKLIIVDASLSRMAFKTEGSEYTLSPEQFSVDSILALIKEAAEEIDAKRVVVDSFSALDTLIETKKMHVGMSLREDIRRALLGINYRLQSMGLTTILINDVVGEELSTHGVEEFMVDGVISLKYQNVGPDSGRHLMVKKMRSTGHSENIHTIEFVPGTGIKILSYS